MFLSQALDLLRCRDPVDGQHPFSTLINRIEQTLGSSLNGVRICIKRDDAISLGSGGNKLRKPERLLDDDAKLPFLSSSSASRSRRRKSTLCKCRMDSRSLSSRDMKTSRPGRLSRSVRP